MQRGAVSLSRPRSWWRKSKNVVRRLLPDSPAGTLRCVQQSATLEKSVGGSGGCIYSISSSLDLKRSTLPRSSARASRSRTGSTSRPTEPPPPPPPGPATGAIPKKKNTPVKEEVIEAVVEPVVEPVVAPGAAALPPPAPVPNSLSEARAILPMYSLTRRSGVGRNSSTVRPPLLPRPEMLAHYSAGGAVQRGSAAEEPARVVVGQLPAIRAGRQADLHDILVNRRRAMAFSDCEDTDGY